MKKKRIVIISIIIAVLAIIGTGIYLYLNKEDKKTTLIILEKK